MATASVSSRSTTASRPENLDTMLPGPASRNNNGCCDCSLSGLLVYGAGSGAVVVDPRSMQLVSVLPMPSPFTSSSTGAGSVAPFVTAVRWSPHTLPRDLVGSEEEVLANLHFRLAVGDRQGRIAIWDFRSKQIVLWLESDDRSKLAIQDLCWFRSDMWILASISGPSLLSLWDISTGRCFWKYDCSPELFSCIRRDPFDPHHFCVLGLRGFLLSVRVFGNKEDNVAINEQQIPLSSDLLNEIQKLEKDSSASSTTPAFAAFPHFFAKFCFSPRWKYIIHVTFPKELVSYDLQYGTSLSSLLLPRGMGKFMDIVPDMDDDFLYCAHLDGKLSTWKCREGDLVSMFCTVEELIPLIGTAVPSPCVLAIIICQYESTIQNIGNLCSDLVYTPALPGTLDPKSEVVISGNRHLMSISDDGKVWNWLLTSENARAHQKMASRMDPNINSIPDFGYNLVKDSVLDASVPRIDATASKLSFKISLIGQLHLLSSTVVTLAVPSPSLTATLARGGNNPAAAVPLVALGTQNGTIDIIDVSANAVAASFSVHSSVIRGLRWLGNSRLVSFSYSQASDKGGGYANKLVVTCVRSGLNRTFRVLQKPERAPVRALRASSSGRYLLVMFRDAPVEVWAMTKNPIMLRSLALPFTVLEWTLPTAPRPTQHGSSIKSQPVQREHSAAASANTSPGESKMTTTDASAEDTSESFAFALVNGALGVFEVQGRRIRDFRPKWPSSSFVSSDGLVTAMAYRQPHVVMGDRLGYIRWWDVTSGLSSSFYTHKEGIRRIKFSPVVPGDRSRGRVAVLFYDNSFSIFDLDTPDPLANALLQPQSTGTLVVELDWLPTRTSKDEPLVLCIAGADSSFRLIEININETKSNSLSKSSFLKERFRPMPLCLPILFPTAHVLALRMVLQFGVKSSWFKTLTTNVDKFLEKIPDTDEVSNGDLRSYMIESSLPPIGDSVVPELFLKVLESYRREGYLLDRELSGLYSSIVNKGCIERLAFSAAIFGEFQEAFFWLQLPRALRHSLDKEVNKSFLGEKRIVPDTTNMSKLIEATSEDNFPSRKHHPMQNIGQLNLMAFEQAELWRNANERIPWHEKLDGDDAIQKRVHELVSVGNLEAAVTLLLSTPPEGPHFYPNALRAIALSSAVSRSLHELAVKVVAANMVRTDKSFTGIHLLCAVGRYQEACSQLQDAGCWTDAATLAATHLQGSDYARMLQRWAHHVLHSEHNLWRAVILYVAAGAMREALAALRDSKHPDTAAMFLLACHEIYAQITSKPGNPDNTLENIEMDNQTLVLPYMNQENEDVMAASEYFGQYQRKLVHLCMDEAPFFD